MIVQVPPVSLGNHHSLLKYPETEGRVLKLLSANYLSSSLSWLAGSKPPFVVSWFLTTCHPCLKSNFSFLAKLKKEVSPTEPLTRVSGFMMIPKVRNPSGSSSRARFRIICSEKLFLAVITANIIHRGFFVYDFTSSVTSSTSWDVRDLSRSG